MMRADEPERRMLDVQRSTLKVQRSTFDEGRTWMLGGERCASNNTVHGEGLDCLSSRWALLDDALARMVARPDTDGKDCSCAIRPWSLGLRF